MKHTPLSKSKITEEETANHFAKLTRELQSAAADSRSRTSQGLDDCRIEPNTEFHWNWSCIFPWSIFRESIKTLEVQNYSFFQALEHSQNDDDHVEDDGQVEQEAVLKYSEIKISSRQAHRHEYHKRFWHVLTWHINAVAKNKMARQPQIPTVRRWDGKRDPPQRFIFSPALTIKVTQRGTRIRYAISHPEISERFYRESRWSYKYRTATFATPSYRDRSSW